MLATTAVAAAAATLIVGADAGIRTVAQAASVARDGDTIEILPGEYRGDVAVWRQKQLTIRGVGPGTPVLVAAGRSAQNKAIWVIPNGDFVIENVAFEGARVASRNGAGIRFERGRLTLRRCRFTGNEIGLLVGNARDGELTIEDSEFSRAPHDHGSLHHLLYVGTIARFTLTGSRFHQGFEGHLVKTRARENYISYNLLYDGENGMAAYELEFPNGGIAYVTGNVIGQSATTTNPVVIAYGAEGTLWDDNVLYLVNNTLVSDRPTGAWFLRVWSGRVPGDTSVLAVNNLTAGVGLFTLGSKGTFEGNYPVFTSALSNANALDFRLATNSLLRGAGVSPPVIDGRSLAPVAEFRLPLGTTPIARPPAWTPGAFQTAQPR